MSINTFRQNLLNNESSSPMNHALVKLQNVSNPADLLSKSSVDFFQWQPWNPDAETNI